MVFCCQCWPELQHGTAVQENALRIFTLAELQLATKMFEKSSEARESRSGSIQMGIIRSLTSPYNNINVVMKPVKIEQMTQMGKMQLESKLRSLGDIKHQNLVKLIGYCIEEYKHEMIIVYEYVPNRSLDHHLSSLPWRMRLRIAKDAAAGLAYLHEQPIIFKDFKLSNVLLDNLMKAKLSYFGFVREAPQRGQTEVTTSVAGTTQGYSYSAPEYVKKGRLTTKMDVWSYGIFLRDLITGGLPAYAKENLESNPECMRWVCCNASAGMTELIVDPMLEGKYSDKSMQKIVYVANKCLVLEPKHRPKMSVVLKLVNEAIQLETSIIPTSKCCLDLDKMLKT